MSSKRVQQFLLLLAVITGIVSCKNISSKTLAEEGFVQGETYNSDEMGWSMEIPKGWNIMQKDKIAANFKAGADAIDKVSDEEFDYSGLKYLINFQKDQFNIFQSTSEKFELQYEGEWEENNAGQKIMICDIFKNQGIRFDTISSKEKIDGLDFNVFHIKIKDRKGNVILYQDMYARYINGSDFGAVLNYNNDEDKEVLMRVWKNSKFKKGG